VKFKIARKMRHAKLSALLALLILLLHLGAALGPRYMLRLWAALDHLGLTGQM